MKEFAEILEIDGNTHFAFKKNNYDEGDNIENKLDDFEFLQILGKGGFGSVFKVASKLNNKIYAMEIVNLRKLKLKSEKAYQLSLDIIKFLPYLSHPHVIKYYNNFIVWDYIYQILEYAENGDLNNLIETYIIKEEYIPEEELWNIFLQCIEWLAYLHKIGLIHRNIKSGNILIDKNMNINISDFRFAKMKQDEENDNDYEYEK